MFVGMCVDYPFATARSAEHEPICSLHCVHALQGLNKTASTQMLVKELGRAINQALEKSKTMHEV